MDHGQAHPLCSNRDTIFQGVDLLRLFKYSADNRVDFMRTSIETGRDALASAAN